VVRNIVKEAPGLAEDFNVETVAVIVRFNRFWRVNKESAMALFKADCFYSLKKLYYELRSFVSRFSSLGKIEYLLISYSRSFLSVVFNAIFSPLVLVFYLQSKRMC